MCSSNLIKQYVESVRDFSSQYGTEGSISYTVLNLIGDYKMCFSAENHESSQSYLMRSYGPWAALSPCAPKMFNEKSHHLYYSQDYVELKYEVNVYPSAVEICEPNHVGAVSKIFAFDSNSLKWHLLWERTGECSRGSHHNGRTFAPPIRKVKFVTNLIRLEFHHSFLEYYAELKSVCLLGFEGFETKDNNFAPKLHLQKEFRYTNSTPTGLNAISCNFEDTLPIGFGRLTVLHSTDQVLSVNKSLADTRDENYLDKLPVKYILWEAFKVKKEIFHMIVKYLDLSSLCNASRCDRLLHQLCYDPLLFYELDLQPYWHKVSDHTLTGLLSRCCNIQRLNLSWCGNNGSISLLGINCTCGRNLTCLHLSCCPFINAEVLEVISENCSQLKELDLSNCNIEKDKGIQLINRFHHLLWLNLYCTQIDLDSLRNILENCSQLRYLNLGSCLKITNFDECASIICRACRDLEGLNLWRARTLTSIGVRCLTALTKLEELDIGWCVEVSPATGCLRELARACPSIKKLVLSAFRYLSDSDILCFAEFCVHLEQLDILGAREVTASSCYKLLSSCKKLKLIDVTFCAQVDSITCNRWKEDFPSVSIKRFN